MKYLKRFGLFIFAIILFVSAFVVTSQPVQAQRTVYYRPVVVSRPFVRPFFYSRFYDPFYDPYYYDPYLSYQQEKYYKEKDVRDARKKVAKETEKYGANSEKAIKAQEKYAKAVSSLNKFYRNS
ncbi:MAG TPA: hypothetical protein VEV84_15270 [Pyrinomonadaceae bacterium]|nr:hypothetical protein [Pyrinomonadaceae bacterium]